MATLNDGLYDTGSKILADHYNTFVTGDPVFGVQNNDVANINTLWGSGSGDKGYGQSTTLAEVALSNTVTATQWSTLLTRSNSLASHQGTVLGAALSPTGGDLIEAIATLGGNINLLDTNRLDALATGTSDTITASDGTGWALTSTHTTSVQFASADAARYFFNAGGHIDISCSRVGGNGTLKELDWDDQSGGGLTGDVGTISLYAHSTVKSGGSGPYGGGTSNIEHSIGYYELNTSGIELFRQFASGSVYTVNKINVTVNTNGPQSVNNDNGGLITFVTEMLDPSTTDDPITGTTNVNVLVRYPSTTVCTDASWGAVTFPTNQVVQV
jgi:hypothetical protein